MRKFCLLVCITLHVYCNAQPTFTTTIVSSATNSCIAGTVTLSVNNVGDSWTQTSFLGIGRYEAVAFSIGNKGYVGLGTNGTSTMNDFWEYDPVFNTWTQKANYPGTILSGAVGFSIGNKGYVGTGKFANSYSDEFWEYDPLTDSWTQKANFGGGIRGLAFAFSLGNKGYVGTGITGLYPTYNYYNDLWEYDQSTDVWTQKSNFVGSARYRAAAFSIANKGYMGTGKDQNGQLNDFWEYNPVTDIWLQRASFSGIAREGSAGIGAGCKGYIGAGRASLIDYNDFWEYDPVVDNWTQKMSFSGLPVLRPIGFSLGGKCFMGTGVSLPTNQLINDILKYDPELNYLWSTGATTLDGAYTVTLTNAVCQSAVSSYSLFQQPILAINNQTLCATSSVVITPTITASAGTTYSWLPGNFSTASATVSPASTTSYSLYATNSVCTSSVVCTVSVIPVNTSITNFSYTTPLCCVNSTSYPLLPTNFLTGGTFLSSSGLDINSNTGAINLGSSLPGNYTVNYLVNPQPPCATSTTGNCLIVLNQIPTISTVADVTIDQYSSTILTANSSTGTYTWYPETNLSCSQCYNPVASPPESTTYCVKTTDGVCMNSVCVLVNVESPCSKNYELSLPNAFSPNGDNLNDQFCLQGKKECLSEFSIIVYDRWGEKVFESADPAFRWDGVYRGLQQNSGMFIYYAKAKFGETQHISKKGNVTLIR